MGAIGSVPGRIYFVAPFQGALGRRRMAARGAVRRTGVRFVLGALARLNAAHPCPWRIARRPWRWRWRVAAAGATRARRFPGSFPLCSRVGPPGSRFVPRPGAGAWRGPSPQGRGGGAPWPRRGPIHFRWRAESECDITPHFPPPPPPHPRSARGFHVKWDLGPATIGRRAVSRYL